MCALFVGTFAKVIVISVDVMDKKYLCRYDFQRVQKLNWQVGHNNN